MKMFWFHARLHHQLRHHSFPCPITSLEEGDSPTSAPFGKWTVPVSTQEGCDWSGISPHYSKSTQPKASISCFPCRCLHDRLSLRSHGQAPTDPQPAKTPEHTAAPAALHRSYAIQSTPYTVPDSLTTRYPALLIPSCFYRSSGARPLASCE